MGHVTTRTYRDGALAEEGFPLEGSAAHLSRSATAVWIDMCAPSADQLRVLADEFGLHELAVEDALGRQRPKLDRYDDHLFLSCHAVAVDARAASLVETEVDAFIGPRWLITVRQDANFKIESVFERLERSPRLLTGGVGAILYALLDTVVDGYFEVIQAFDDYHNLLSERILAEQPRGHVPERERFEMRRAMFRFHRLLVPMREVCGSLVRREEEAVGDELHPYFLDVYDHVLGALEDLDAQREIATTILDLDISLRDHRQNLIVKKVTGWAAIIAVPTLVTGYYGMNVPYAGSGEVGGVVTATVIMIVACALLYLVFRRRNWL